MHWYACKVYKDCPPGYPKKPGFHDRPGPLNRGYPLDPYRGSCLEGTGRSCWDVTGVYLDGESWTCADGCNSCWCTDGNIMSTRMACPELQLDNALMIG